MNPFGAGDGPASAWLGSYADDVSRYVARRMTLGDATLAREADRYGAKAIVTWNVKDFFGRTAVPVLTPEQFMKRVPRGVGALGRAWSEERRGQRNLQRVDDLETW